MRQEIEQTLQAEQYEQAQAMLVTWFAEQQKIFTNEPQPHAVNLFLSDLIKILHRLLIEYYLKKTTFAEAKKFYETWVEKLEMFNRSLADGYKAISHNQCLLVDIQNNLSEIQQNFKNLCDFHTEHFIIKKLVLEQAHCFAKAVLTTAQDKSYSLQEVNKLYHCIIKNEWLDALQPAEQIACYGQMGKMYLDWHCYEEALDYYTQAYRLLEQALEKQKSDQEFTVLQNSIITALNKIELYVHSLAKAKCILTYSGKAALREFFSVTNQLCTLGSEPLNNFYKVLASPLQQCLLELCETCRTAIETTAANLKEIYAEICYCSAQLKSHRQQHFKKTFLDKLLDIVRPVRKSLPDYFNITAFDAERVSEELEAIHDDFEKHVTEGRWLNYRKELQHYRKDFWSNLKANEDISKVQLTYSNNVCQLLKKMATDIVDLLGQTPEDYLFNLFGFGSISRGDMSLYSDVDCALLVEHEKYRDDLYLRQFVNLLAFHLKALGDPWSPDEENAGEKKYLGLHLDSGYFPEDKPSNFINTPDGMIYWMQSELEQIRTKAIKTKALNIVLGLYRITPIFSNKLDANNQLCSNYKQKLSNGLFAFGEETNPKSIEIAQWDYACHRMDTSAKLKDFTNKIKFDFKKTLLSPFINWCQDAALLTKIIEISQEDKSPVLIAIILSQLEKLTSAPHFVILLKIVLTELYHFRITYQYRNRSSEILLHKPDKSPSESIAALRLETEHYAKLHSIGEFLKLLYVLYLPTKDNEILIAQQHFNAEFLNDPIGYAIQHLSENEVDRNPIILRSIAQTLITFAPESIHLAYYQQIPEVHRKSYIQLLSEIKVNPEKQIPKVYHHPNQDGWRPIIDVKKYAWYQALKTLFRQDPIPKTIEKARKAGKPIIKTRDLDHPDTANCKEYLLTPEATTALFTKKGEFKPKPKGQDGRHTVLPVTIGGHTFQCKLAPEQPAAETLTEELSWLMLGDGTPCTLVVKISRGSRSDVMLIAEDINYVQTLSGKDIKAFPQRLKQIDKRSFTQHFLRVLMTNPEDDKGDDYLLVRSLPVSSGVNDNNDETYELKRIDRERVFFNPKETQKRHLKFTDKKVLLVKSIIFCLNQLYEEAGLDDEVLLQFAEGLDAETLLQRWLGFAQREEEFYRQLFSEAEVHEHFKRPDLEFTLATVFLPKGLARELWNRMEATQAYIKLLQEMKSQGNTVTALHTRGMHLLESVQPLLAKYYKSAFLQYPLQAERPDLAEARFYFLTPNSYVLTEEGKRNTSLSGQIALTKNSNAIQKEKTRCFDAAYALAIFQGEKESASEALAELEALIKEDTEKIAKAILQGDKKIWKSFELLSSKRQMVIIRIVLEQLEAGISGLARGKGKVRVLQAMAKMRFIRLDLKPFFEVLTNELLTAILIASRDCLIELNLAKCNQLTPNVFTVLAKYCPNVEKLIFTHLSKPAVFIGVINNTTIGGITLEKLRYLDISESSMLTTISITTPQLRYLHASNCKALKSLQTQSQDLQVLDLSGCEVFLESSLAKISIDAMSLKRLQITGCNNIEHQAFRKKYPFLLGSELNLNLYNTGYIQDIDLLLGEILVGDQSERLEVRQRVAQTLSAWFSHIQHIQIQLLAALKSSEWEVRAAAAQALGQLGQENSEVITALLTVLKDSDGYLRAAAAQALGRLGQGNSEVITALLRALEDSFEDVRAAAAQALGRLGQGNSEVITALLRALKDSDGDVRAAAAQALGELGQGNSKVITVLLRALKDSFGNVRAAAAQALGRLGQGNSEVITALLRALKDSDGDVRAAAAQALGELGQGNSKVITVLLRALKDSFGNVRAAAAQALGRLGQGNSEVITALLTALKYDSYGDVRAAAAQALGRLGQGNSEVITTLLRALKDSDGDVRAAAAQALGELGQGNSEVITALLSTLKDVYGNVQPAAQVLEELGRENSEVITALLTALKYDSYGDVRAAAAQALGRLGQENSEVITALLSTLKDVYENVQVAAAQALGRLGHGNSEVITTLLRTLKDSYGDVRAAAAQALGRLGHGNSEVITTLLRALKDSYGDVRAAAAQALGRLGQGNSEVITTLLRALKDSYGDVREAAAQALGQLGQRNSEVITVLLTALKDSDKGVRAAVVKVLGQLGQMSTLKSLLKNALAEIKIESWHEQKNSAQTPLPSLSQHRETLFYSDNNLTPNIKPSRPAETPETRAVSLASSTQHPKSDEDEKKESQGVDYQQLFGHK